jgi:hypothetical protein
MSDAETTSPEALAIRDRMIRGESISWDEVVSWMQSGNVELEGAAFQALMGSERLVDGTVDPDVANEFMFRYLLSALSHEGSPAQIFDNEPYIAGQSIAAIYKEYRLKGAWPRLLDSTRDELARLYVSGDAKQKARVVNGVLEHILEEPVCRGDFGGWKSHPELRQAFSEALEWSEPS